MLYRDHIHFVLNGRDVVLKDIVADQTLLDYLRIEQRLTGTKEGCAEGDCGACTVLVGRLEGETLHYEAVNACIRFLPSLDHCHVVTVEALASPQGALHPVQQAMVAHHGSQCGFCTPGFVMALYALWMENLAPSEAEIETALQGNLCRCTGYEPIVKAALAMHDYGSPLVDHLTLERVSITQRLLALRDGKRVVVGPQDNQAILPFDVDDLADVLAEHPEATIIAGSTDVGLWVTKLLKPISPAVFMGHLSGLKTITLTEETLSFGASVTYSELQETLAAAFPHLVDYWRRIAGWQVRNMGTIGGNIANGSPIGDTPPILIALGAEIVLRHGTKRRRIALQDFFIDYGKQDRAAGEFVESIHIPRASARQINAAYKISKRRDEDISSLAVGISVDIDEGLIKECCIAFGGMAATPKRSPHAEAALRGQKWGAEAFEAAAKALGEDFKPLSDWRATEYYRMQVAGNLLRRFYLDHNAATTYATKLARV